MTMNQKRTVFVGGLAENVSVDILQAAFLPFGDISDCQIPKDAKLKQSRGFGFVTFEDPDDAKEAIRNMHNGELFGRVIKCNIAKPSSSRDSVSKPLWASGEYFENMTKS